MELRPQAAPPGPLFNSSVEFDCLECAICLSQASEPSSIIALPDAAGVCTHNFCDAHLRAHVEHSSKGGAKPLCPSCRREILGVAPNLAARDLLRRLNDRKQLLDLTNDSIRRLEERARMVAETSEKLQSELERVKRDRSSESNAAHAEQARLHAQVMDVEGRLQSLRQQAGREKAEQQAASKLEKETLQSKWDEEKKKEQVRELQQQLQQALLAAQPSSPGALSPGGNISSNNPKGAAAVAPSWIARMKQTMAAGTSMLNAVLWAPPVPGPLVRQFPDYKLLERRGVMPTSPVWRAIENTSGRAVALKKIHFEGAGITAFREAFLLHQLDHDNVLKLRGLTRPPGAGFAYLVLDFLEADLEYFLSGGQRLSPEIIRGLFWRVLSILRYLHDMDVVHLELKPTSILFPSPRAISLPDLKLGSFGNAHSLHAMHPHETLGSSSMHHWAPELIYLESRQVQNWKAVDMWAAGALLAQLFSPSYAPLFAGLNGSSVLAGILSLKECAPTFDQLAAHPVLQTVDAKVKASTILSSLAQRLPDAPPLALDLIAQLLHFDPSRRLNVVRALSHDYFADMEGRKAQKPFYRLFPAAELKDENTLTFLQDQCADLC